MRRPQLAMLRGGGEEAPCDLCARGLFLGEDAHSSIVKAQILAYVEEARAANRIRVCPAHREDLAGMGVELVAPLAEAKPNRRQRRATVAVMQRAHRASLPRRRPPPEPSKPQGGGGGGIAF